MLPGKSEGSHNDPPPVGRGLISIFFFHVHQYFSKSHNACNTNLVNVIICVYQTRSVATNCDILDEDRFMTMLHMYHDLGVLIYFGGDGTDQKKALKDIVILDPQWLINVFKAVITILPYKEQVSLPFL